MAKRTYKLLIADDEYWTREKLRNMVDWSKYNIEFMNPAQDGEEVLKRLENELPDILITDINMPFINGVELVKQVKEKYPQIVVFVISGYDDFEYVKETLVAGAINYLLKPVAKIDLVSALSHALEIISSKEENEKQIVKAASLLQDREMSLLVEKEQTLLSPTIIMNAGQEFAGCSIMLVKIHELGQLMAKYEYDMNYLSYSIKKQVRQITGQDNLLIFNYIYRSNEFLIVTEQEISEQKHMAIQILDCLKQQTSSPVTIAVSERSFSIESIHNAYVQSISVLMARPYTKDNIILFYNQERKNTDHQVKNRLTQESEWQLKGLLKAGNDKAVKEYIRDVLDLKSCNTKGWDYLEVKQTSKRIATVYMDHLLQIGGQEDAIRELEELEQMMDKGIERLDAEVVCEHLDGMLEVLSEEKKSELTGNIKDVVREAVAYIDKNYFEELTLASLAEKYCVESTYFSRIFKQETGENLMLYITGKRMEKAKEIIRNADISMAEVAFMVGYDDYTYFSKVFKKMTGMSPRDYRAGLE